MKFFTNSGNISRIGEERLSPPVKLNCHFGMTIYHGHIMLKSLPFLLKFAAGGKIYDVPSYLWKPNSQYPHAYSTKRVGVSSHSVRTGIDFSGSDLEKLSFDEWSDTAERLMFIEAGIQWTVGDWFNMGERLYGEMYSQVMDASKLAYGTLANYKYVASKVEFSFRNENLSWTHHKEVASLSTEFSRRRENL